MKNYKRRDFIKDSLALASLTILPLDMLSNTKKTMIRTAHIGVGGMGKADLEYISSHKNVEVVALCDVDSDILMTASKSYPKAKTYKDYRILLNEMNSKIDAVIVSTPDHSHAPASLMAMKMNKAVYCQKPLTHHVSEAREMRKIAKEKNLVTQMGIQVHSFYEHFL